MPKEYVVNNVKGVFYTLGEVATLIGKKIITLRMWERKGLLPKASFRYKGRRLYTLQQVQNVVKWQEENKLRKGMSMTDVKPIVL